MTSGSRIFFSGIGTAFIIMATGFGGGLMFAKTAVNDSPSQNRASTHQIAPVRVIPLTTAEAAPVTQSVAAVQPVPAPEVKVPEKQVEKVDTRKAEAEERAHKKRVAELKARKARQQMEARLRVQPRSSEPNVMAFSDEPRQVSFFGN
jgi:hypothetical protein